MHLQIVDVPCAMLVCQRVMDKKTATRLHLETSHPMVMCCFSLAKDSCQTSPVLCTPKVWKPGFSHKKFSAAQAISIIVKQHQHVNFANLPRNGCLHQNKCFERLLGLVTGDHGLNLSPRHPTVSERKIWSDERNHPKPVSLILWNLFSSQLFKKDERTSPKKHFQTKCLSKRRETQNDQNVFKLELSTFLQQKSHLFFSHRFLLHPENQHLLNTKNTTWVRFNTALFGTRHAVNWWHRTPKADVFVWRVGRFLHETRPKSVGLNVCSTKKWWLIVFWNQWSFILGIFSGFWNPKIHMKVFEYGLLCFYPETWGRYLDWTELLIKIHLNQLA